MIKLLNGAYALFKSSKNNEKRLLLKTLFSNLFLDAEKLVFSRVEVLSKMEKIRFYPKWQGHQGSNPGPTVLETVALPAELYPFI